MNQHRDRAAECPDTLHDLLGARATDASRCLIDEGSEISWTELSKRSAALATGFAGLGVSAGDRVAIWLPNRAAWLASFFACAQLGAIAVSINTRFRSAEVSDLLRRSASKLLVYWPGFKDIDFSGILAQCDGDALAKLETVVLYTEDDASIARSVVSKPAVLFKNLLTRPPMITNEGSADGPCVIFTTSGTTKAPKLVVHSQRNVIAHALNVARQYGLTPQDCFLLLPPFCGVFGFCSAMACLVAGTPLILHPIWHPEQYAGLVESCGITHMTASNEAIAQLFAARPDKSAFGSVRFIVSANLNPAHADIAARGEARGIEIIGLYGSSEVQGLFSHNDRDADAEYRGRAGGRPASAHARVRTRDRESGVLCDVGAAGELEILAPESRFLGYFNDIEATQCAFTADGYFMTGDLGVIEPDGSFTFLARMGDALRLGGVLVSPAEIEELIQQHSGVESCQIVGVRAADAIKPVAFVIPRGGSRVEEADVVAYAAQRLAKFKVPVKVYVVDQFPMTPGANGSKVQKGKLREMAEANLGVTAGVEHPSQDKP